jgi:hypothetical protein
MTRPEYRMHKCPVRDCGMLVEYRKFACHQHWAVLPSSHKAAIYAGYTIGPLSEPHLDAMRIARQWFRENLGRANA